MRFKIETKKTKEEVIEILKQNTSEPQGIFSRNYEKFFIGKVNEDSFKIWRKIDYRNSFLPLIIGKVKEDDEGCKIVIKTRMILFVIIFCCIWFGCVLFACAATLSGLFPMPHGIVPFIMLIAGGLVVFLPKRMEEKKAKEKFEELFLKNNEKCKSAEDVIIQ